MCWGSIDLHMGRKKKRKKDRNSHIENHQPQQPSSPPPLLHSDSQESVIKKGWFWAAIFFLVPLSFPVIFHDSESATVIYLAWGIWGIALVGFLVGFWQQFAWNRLTKVVIVLVVASIF